MWVCLCGCVCVGVDWCVDYVYTVKSVSFCEHTVHTYLNSCYTYPLDLEHLQQHLDTHQQTLGSGRDVWMAQVNTTLQKSNSVAIESQKRLSEDMQTVVQTEVQKMMQG